MPFDKRQMTSVNNLIRSITHTEISSGSELLLWNDYQLSKSYVEQIFDPQMAQAMLALLCPVLNVFKRQGYGDEIVLKILSSLYAPKNIHEEYSVQVKVRILGGLSQLSLAKLDIAIDIFKNILAEYDLFWSAAFSDNLTDNLQSVMLNLSLKQLKLLHKNQNLLRIVHITGPDYFSSNFNRLCLVFQVKNLNYIWNSLYQLLAYFDEKKLDFTVVIDAFMQCDFATFKAKVAILVAGKRIFLRWQPAQVLEFFNEVTVSVPSAYCSDTTTFMVYTLLPSITYQEFKELNIIVKGSQTLINFIAAVMLKLDARPEAFQTESAVETISLAQKWARIYEVTKKNFSGFIRNISEHDLINMIMPHSREEFEKGLLAFTSRSQKASAKYTIAQLVPETAEASQPQDFCLETSNVSAQKVKSVNKITIASSDNIIGNKTNSKDNRRKVSIPSSRSQKGVRKFKFINVDERFNQDKTISFEREQLIVKNIERLQGALDGSARRADRNFCVPNASLLFTFKQANKSPLGYATENYGNNEQTFFNQSRKRCASAHDNEANNKISKPDTVTTRSNYINTPISSVTSSQSFFYPVQQQAPATFTGEQTDFLLKHF